MICERESEAVAARLKGEWPAELKAHVAQCLHCQDALLVAALLTETAEKERVEVPAAGLVWFKSQLRLKREAVERAERPLVWGQRAAAVIAGAGVVWAASWAMDTSASLAVALIGSCIVLGLTAGGLLLAARERE
ncbi:MAG: hypothetical protein HXY18_04835 [Bryobacteraceae bacterium]|nr:hypothetical protein [Bryobacteraceae bacterium]